MTGTQMLTLLSQKIEDESNTLLTEDEKILAINQAQIKAASLVDKAFLHPLEVKNTGMTLTNGEKDLSESYNWYSKMLFRKLERVVTEADNREYYIVDFEESAKLDNEYYEQTNTESQYAGHCYLWGSTLVTKPAVTSTVEIYYYRKPKDFVTAVSGPDTISIGTECELDVLLHEPIVDLAASSIFFRDNKDARGVKCFENAIAIINVANQRELDVIEKGTGLKT